jgi:1,4-alpha-glucan branching enzyme
MAKVRKGAPSSEAVQRLLEARHHDPFEILGFHPLADEPGEVAVRVFLPAARSAQIHLIAGPVALTPIDGGLWLWSGVRDVLRVPYQIEWIDYEGHTHVHYDPYCFAPQLGELDLHLFGEGRHWHVYRMLGAHLHTVDGVEGVRFATWAPGAERVSVVGDFNNWDQARHPMRVRGGGGVWELFIPGLKPGILYKFSIRPRGIGEAVMKIDPYGRQFEMRPSTSSILPLPSAHQWNDGEWLARRAHWDWLHAPVSVYEVHLSSWRRDPHGGFLNYREIAHQLVGYVKSMGFTHVEIMPVTEHPLDDSWGYQTTGYYAPTSRFGTPDDFRYFVDHLHQHGLGLILDWVPAHFPKDSHGLARFDGTALYEHEDVRKGEHRDWGTLIYNFSRNEVRNFLLANALYWLEEFHVDGLRVDAVAAMIHLDYSREEGEWVPNIHGGNENLEAIDFLRQLNEICHGQHPGCMVIAEESTAWPQVTRPTWVGGLGFSMKWNMGWMHDTLDYMSKDPIHRHYHHDKLTFGLVYAFSENFQLPLSHDEVVHGKGSMINKMPGDYWQRFANLRLLYTYQFTYPGSKLLFMGNEFGQWKEWAHGSQLDWVLLEYPLHNGLKTLVKDLNGLYTGESALHRYGFEQQGFEWIDCHDSTQSIISYLRRGDHGFCIVIFNFTPVPRHNYRIGVPEAGEYREVFNSDSSYYGGSNLGNPHPLHTQPVAWMGREQSLMITLPPLGALILRKA